MNTQNYGFLAACQRLIEAGIVLETDFVWALNGTGWHFFSRDWATKMVVYYELIPAASMTEVWRELPEQHDDEYLRVFKDGVKTFCGYGEYADRWSSENPTDALIDLLIWLKQQNRERIVKKLIDQADKLKW